MPLAETASTFNETHITKLAISKTEGLEKLALLESLLMNTTQITCDIYSRYLFESRVFEECKDRLLMPEDLKEIIPGKEYLALGSARLDDISDELNLNLDSEDYDSIGGYIIEQLDKLPVQGQSVTLDNGLRLVVEKTSKNRVELVHIYLPEPAKIEEED